MWVSAKCEQINYPYQMYPYQMYVGQINEMKWNENIWACYFVLSKKANLE